MRSNLIFGRCSGIALFFCLLASASSVAQDAVVDSSGATSDDSAIQQRTTEKSFVYKTVAGRDLRIDCTRPADWNASDRRASVVFMHGGGWTGGTPGQFSPHSIELAEQGMVCFRVEYRLLDKAKRDPPAVCAEDVTDAFRYVRTNAASLGLDANRIAAGGGSAGGHLAAWLGMMDDAIVDGISRKPNALLLFNPVYDNRPGQWGDKRVGDRVKEFSPSENITADDPPAIVHLGTKDALIPVAAAKRFRDAMTAVGVLSELRLYEGQTHGFFNKSRDGGKWYRQTMDHTLSFLKSLGWLPSPPRK